MSKPKKQKKNNHGHFTDTQRLDCLTRHLRKGEQITLAPEGDDGGLRVAIDKLIHKEHARSSTPPNP